MATMKPAIGFARIARRMKSMIERNAAALTAVVGLLLSPVFAPTAVAQNAPVQADASQPCSCPLPVSGNGVVGRLLSSSGDVLVSQRTGFGSARRGAALSVGSQILVGPSGSATAVFGRSCSISFPANSSVHVEKSGGKLCVRSLDRTVTAAVGDPPNQIDRLVTQGIFAGSMVTSVAVGLGHQNSVSH